MLLAIVAVGFNASYGIWLAGAGSAPEHEAHVLRGIQRLDRRFANPAYALLLVTGGILVVDGDWGFGTGWLVVSIVLYAVMAAVGLFGYSPALRRQLEALERFGPASVETKTAARRATATGGITAVLVLVIVFLMVTKPG